MAAADDADFHGFTLQVINGYEDRPAIIPDSGSKWNSRLSKSPMRNKGTAPNSTSAI
jgi:hypothetical protein